MNVLASLRDRLRPTWLVALLALFAAATMHSGTASAARPAQPNIVLIMTDDQGYGDLAFHNNPIIRTPNLDRLAADSVQMQNFYVCPVCSPTRSSLLTGRYNYRTGVVDTYLGRSMMHADEVTLAEMLASAGYRTGIFGKWHLGDNYPLRPQDQGFGETLVLKGGGIGQPSDPPGGSSYFDPLLLRNGELTKTQGYCSDVFTDAAIDFIENNHERPFFAYLPFNAPHAPLEVPEEDYQLYKDMELSADQFPDTGYPIEGKPDHDQTARVYGMVTNIDYNVGRLLAALDDHGLARTTIVIFLTDNGPQQPRFNGGMRGRKGSVYDGGIRVPCFVRWTGTLTPGRQVRETAAHIDVVPTLVEACGIDPPADVHFDGLSLLPLLTSEQAAWPDRTLFFQWHRGDVPQRFRAFAARSSRWKLVQPRGVPPGETAELGPLQLFDMAADPYEMHDKAAGHPEIVEQLKGEYEQWFAHVAAERQFAPPRIFLGSKHENPVTLTRQDWRGERAGSAPGDRGHWLVQVDRPGTYRVTVHFAAGAAGSAHFATQGIHREAPLAAGETSCVFDSLPLQAGPCQLDAWLTRGSDEPGAQYLEVELLESSP